MLKRYFLIALALLLVVGTCAGCAEKPAENPINPADYVTVANNGNTEYVLVNCGADAVAIAKFGTLLGNRMGVQLKVANAVPEGPLPKLYFGLHTKYFSPQSFIYRFALPIW